MRTGMFVLAGLMGMMCLMATGYSANLMMSEVVLDAVVSEVEAENGKCRRRKKSGGKDRDYENVRCIKFTAIVAYEVEGEAIEASFPAGESIDMLATVDSAKHAVGDRIQVTIQPGKPDEPYTPNRLNLWLIPGMLAFGTLGFLGRAASAPRDDAEY